MKESNRQGQRSNAVFCYSPGHPSSDDLIFSFLWSTGQCNAYVQPRGTAGTSIQNLEPSSRFGEQNGAEQTKETLLLVFQGGAEAEIIVTGREPLNILNPSVHSWGDWKAFWFRADDSQFLSIDKGRQITIKARQLPALPIT